ncbi:uncharacterized protein NFIA_107480 [Aspergillus fischeri NRRL 181]|uniref:Uncharacterized protein n=1 Tax=Neosartorya fischeri (strain ATCC 1020 / DSM 3700 / CBS 544.65 / FGSC A1164 / JCM 1740 / NRRL 181 / WB 181) TaxID=331117 RepID=A1CXA4_NEOFI|nr:uncharacterized protein NFIA_107480 [Aspergillus fischeri NRRL 181]EAW25256.1 hypothetical protein NFIA_107480 [Aspergillus fischeri NRRL 181]
MPAVWKLPHRGMLANFDGHAITISAHTPSAGDAPPPPGKKPTRRKRPDKAKKKEEKKNEDEAERGEKKGEAEGDKPSSE